MTFKQTMGLMWRWLWLIVFCTATGGAAGYTISKRMPPVFEASTTVYINQARLNGLAQDYNEVLTAERVARTYAELMVKRPVLNAVIATLGLPLQAQDLARQIQVTPIRDTQLIKVVVEASNPDLAARISNELVTVFIKMNDDLQNTRFLYSKQNLEQELARIQQEIVVTQATIEKVSEDTKDASVEEVARLQELLSQQRASYTSIFQSIEEVKLAEAQQSSSLSVVEPAMTSNLPVKPQPIVAMVLGALLGGALAALLITAAEYFSDQVRTADDVQSILGVAPLATIGTIKARASRERLVTLYDPASWNAEMYQMLGINLEIAGLASPFRTIVITSANEGEGKSTTAANIAVALARGGKHVLLVDADLRAPTIHSIFNHGNPRGLTTALLQPGDPLTHTVNTPLDNLIVMPSGPLALNPVDILASAKMTNLIEDLKREVDIIIFDSPPLLAVADATVLAHKCDAALLVVESSSTRSKALRQARHKLELSGSTFAGVVLNRSSERGRRYYHYAAEESAVLWWHRLVPLRPNRKASGHQGDRN